MLNHVRTLLLNRTGSLVAATEFGHEYVPADYIAAALLTQLQWVRNALFGAAPDNAGLNYRLLQFAPMLHAPEIEPLTLLADSRVTYWPAVSRFPVVHQPVVVAAKPLVASFVLRPGTLLTLTGQLRREWTIVVSTVLDIPAGQYATVIKVPLSYVTQGTSVPILFPQLPGMTLQIDSEVLEVGDTLQVRVLLEPLPTLESLPAQLASVLTEEVAGLLFGYARSGYFGQFRQMWEDSDRLHERLAGVLLALAYRTEALRRGKVMI